MTDDFSKRRRAILNRRGIFVEDPTATAAVTAALDADPRFNRITRDIGILVYGPQTREKLEALWCFFAGLVMVLDDRIEDRPLDKRQAELAAAAALAIEREGDQAPGGGAGPPWPFVRRPAPR